MREHPVNERSRLSVHGNLPSEIDSLEREFGNER